MQKQFSKGSEIKDIMVLETRLVDTKTQIVAIPFFKFLLMQFLTRKPSLVNAMQDGTLPASISDIHEQTILHVSTSVNNYYHMQGYIKHIFPGGALVGFLGMCKAYCKKMVFFFLVSILIRL